MSEPRPTPSPRAVDIEIGHGVVAAKVVGPTVEANRAAVILQSVREAMDQVAGDLSFVVFDLGAVEYINSTAVAAFLNLAGEATERGAVPVVYRPTGNVAEILRMVKAAGIFTFAKTAHELHEVLGE